MDTRDTPEQAELRRAARQLARDLGPATVADLDDDARRKRLTAAVRDAGWLELRDDLDGAPAASGVEAAIVADALGGAAADTAFIGPALARDLARRAAVDVGDAVVAFATTLTDAGVVTGAATTAPVYAVDTGDGAAALVLNGSQLATVPVTNVAGGADLTRAVVVVPEGSAAQPVAGARPVTADDLAAWRALGLALTSADLVGAMRGVLAVTVDYAADRRQFGVPVGTFQAVQHLLADAHCLLEGSISVAAYAAWGVDNLAAADALAAGRVAKAYCARAARTVCETAVQVHGGIGNTWECIVHVYLRRALLSAQWFGDDAVHLPAIADARVGAVRGLS